MRNKLLIYTIILSFIIVGCSNDSKDIKTVNRVKYTVCASVNEYGVFYNTHVMLFKGE